MTRNLRYIFLPSILQILLIAGLYPQTEEIKFERLAIKQGLSQNSVYCILQDREGYLWFGTRDGLNKYDGYKFIIYKPKPFDQTSLSHNWVYSLCEDDSSALWVGTLGGGLNKFDKTTEKFTHFQHDPVDPNSISDDRIMALRQSHHIQSGTLWIATVGGGFNQYDRKTKRFTYYTHNPADRNSLSNDFVLAIHEDRKGILWIGTNGGGLNKFDSQTGQFTHYQHNPDDPHSLSHNIVSSIYEDPSSDGRILWIGTGAWFAATGGGLNCFDKETGKFVHFTHTPSHSSSISNNSVSSITSDNNGVLWIGTMGGLNRAFSTSSSLTSGISDNRSMVFNHYLYNPNDLNSLSNDLILSLLKDDAGNLWIGTDGGGLSRVNWETGKAAKFKHYKHNPNNPNSLIHNGVWSFWEDTSRSNNILWIGTENGLSKLDRKTGIFTNILLNPDDPSSLMNEILPILRDRAGTLWLGTGEGLFRMDQDNGGARRLVHFKHEPDDPFSLDDNIIWSIIEDRDGSLWIGTGFGTINKFDRKTGKFYHFSPPQTDSVRYTFNGIRKIYQPRFGGDGVFWIATFMGGLLRFDKTSGQFSHYAHDPENPHSLSNNSVLTIYEDTADRGRFLWIGTFGGGLNKFDTGKNEFTHFTIEDGLADNTVWGILGDNNGCLWLSTNQGLSKFDPQTGAFRNYDVSDGLQSNEFNQGAYFKSNKTGELFFGGINGFNVFHPDSLIDNPHIPPIVITDFKVFNESVSLQNTLSTAKEIKLSYKQNFFSFEFAALDYTNPAKNQYAYKLEGLDADWLYSGTRRFASYTNVDPGEYIFRIKGSNNDGLWNEEGSSVKIIITPPFWKTAWAYALYIILIGLALYALRVFEVRRMHLRNELRRREFEAQKLQEIDQLKSRFFANISHEFRTPLTLIKGPLEKLLSGEHRGDTKELYRMMHRNAARLLILINQLLDLSKLESGRMALQTQPENIAEFLRAIVMSFVSMAERKQIKLNFTSTEELLIAYIDRDKLEKIVVNLLSNAIKFTPEGGSVVVDVSIADLKKQNKSEISEFVCIRLKDTGPGIPAEYLPHIFDRFYRIDSSYTRDQEGTGIGLALTKELVEIHHGEISVKSEIGKGSTFTVRLPLGKDHLQPKEILDEPLQSFAEQVSPKEQASTGHLAAGAKKPATSTIQLSNRSNAQSPNILIVEDNVDVRNYICGHLRNEYRVYEAADGAEGLKQAIKTIPDLIISDVMMPQMDGFELCAKLKTDEKTSHIPVILLTARASSESKIEGLGTGADDYLTKPFDAHELQVRIKNLIEQRKKLRERFRKEIVLQPSEIAITSADEKFLQRVMESINRHLSDPDFGIQTFVKEAGMSRMQLHRKLKALTGYSASEFIRIMRLKRAASLLLHGNETVAEIAYQVGFNSPSYFTRCFHEHFGVPPSEYVS